MYNSNMIDKFKKILSLEHYTEILLFVGLPLITFLFLGWKFALSVFILVQIIVFGLVIIRSK